MKFLKAILIPLLFTFRINAQSKLIIKGDSFVGRSVNGEKIRKFIGNVVITQGDVRATCDTAVQNMSTDVARLIGNVVIRQDTVTLRTGVGFFYGREKKAVSFNRVNLFNGHINLSADTGVYFTEKRVAIFKGNVSLKDSSHLLLSRKLIHFEKSDSNLAYGGVIFKQGSSEVFSDSLIFVRNKGFADAKGDVMVSDSTKALKIFSLRLKSYKNGEHLILTGEPVLIKREELKKGAYDTLFISAEKMEAFNDSSALLIARDSVKILRGGFASRNNIAYYFRKGKKLVTFKNSDSALPPVIWYAGIQLTADSVKAFLEKSYLKKVTAVGSGIIISRIKHYPGRFNQISGDSLRMFFSGGKLKTTIVRGNVLSIYYLFEENDLPNGLIKSSSGWARIEFKKGKVAYVKLKGEPVSEYHPEKLVKGKETDFTLPDFKLYKERPDREEIIKSAKNNKNWISHE